jgi:hypothetical protein
MDKSRREDAGRRTQDAGGRRKEAGGRIQNTGSGLEPRRDRVEPLTIGSTSRGRIRMIVSVVMSNETRTPALS